jgi:phosphoglycolate phosphatase
MCQTGQMSATDPSRLVLWDIDHTLIETGGVGRELYRRAFETTTGHVIQQEAEVTGRTEAAILAETLRLHGLEPSAEYEKKYATALAQEYEDHIDQMRERGRVLPGAREALDRLACEPGVVQSVLSGNFKAVAMTKLRAFGLDAFVDFEAGAYGDDSDERPSLVAIAQEHAAARYGATFDQANTVLVGDSPQDVRAAHQGGAEVVAVASGKAKVEELQDAGAELVLPDLTDTDAFLRAVLRITDR